MEYLIAPECLQTEFCLIRGKRPGDGALLYEAVQASLDHLRPWMPWARGEYTPGLAEQHARTSRGSYLLATEFGLGIFSPDGKEYWGGSGFHLREGDLGNRSAEVGMWIRASKAGTGLGTRVLRAVIEWGLEEWPWERLAWRCDARNKASARVAEKAGMSLEGILIGHRRDEGGKRHDTLCYGIVKEEGAPSA